MVTEVNLRISKRSKRKDSFDQTTCLKDGYSNIVSHFPLCRGKLLLNLIFLFWEKTQIVLLLKNYRTENAFWHFILGWKKINLKYALTKIYLLDLNFQLPTSKQRLCFRYKCFLRNFLKPLKQMHFKVSLGDSIWQS